MASDFLSGLWDDVGSAWDEYVKPTDEYKFLEGLYNAGDYLRRESMHGVDLGTKVLGNILGNNLDVSQGKFSIPETRDPFEGIKAKINEANNFSAEVPTVEEQGIGAIPTDSPYGRAAKRLTSNVSLIGRDPLSAFIPQIGGIGDTAIGAGFLAPMIPSLSEKLGTRFSEAYREKPWNSDENLSLLADIVPEAALLAAGSHGILEGSRAIAERLPKVRLPGGYSTRSPIELERSSTRGSVVEDSVPDFGLLSRMAEGGGGRVEEGFLNNLIPELTRPREPFRTIAEHGTSYPSFLERGETPQVSRAGESLGEGLYTSQVQGEAPGYSRIRGAGDKVERVRDRMVNNPYDPTTIKGDVSAEKPLFLDEPAPRDLRMKAMIELNRARGTETDLPLDELKATILDPNSSAQSVIEAGRDLLVNNMLQEARGSYTGDPFSDLIKSAGYDLWATGKRGEPAQEMVIPDPRRQFKIGEIYKTGWGGEVSRPVLSDPGMPPVNPQSLENPTVRISEAPPLENGLKPIELGDFVDELARTLGYKDLPVGSRMVEEGGGNTPKPLDEVRTVQLPKEVQRELDKPIDPAALEVKRIAEEQLRSRAVELSKEVHEGPTATDESSRPVESGSQVSGKGEGSPAWEEKQRKLAEAKDATEQMKVEQQWQNETSKPVDKLVEKDLKESLKVESDYSRQQEKESRLKESQANKDRAAADKRIVTESEKISKAQEKEELALKSFEVKLDNGTRHTVRARNEAEAREFAEKTLSAGGAGRKIQSITPKTTSLEREARGIKPESKEAYEKSLLDDITDLPKTLKSAFDISFGGRQGIFLLNRASALKGLLRGFKSVKEGNHLSVQKDLSSRKNAQLYKDMGLNQISYDPTNPTEISEQFPSQLAEKIPGVKQSQRIYNDQSNLMRANLVDEVVAKWNQQGKTFEKNPELYKGLATYLNTLTGRLPLPKKLAQAGHILNKAFWSPQFVNSRLQMLNPVFYAHLPKEVQRMALRDVGGTLGTLSLLASAGVLVAKQAGYDDTDFQLDSRHTDFGKLRVGKTRYDFFSGLAPIVRTVARITTSTKITPSGKYQLPGGFGLGKDNTLPKAPFGASAGSELGGFIEGKTSPAYQIGKGILTGKGYLGEDYSGAQALEDIAGPMSIFDMLEAGGYNPQNLEEMYPALVKALENPDILKGLPSLVGVGVQTYQEKPGGGGGNSSSSSGTTRRGRKKFKSQFAF